MSKYIIPPESVTQSIKENIILFEETKVNYSPPCVVVFLNDHPDDDNSYEITDIKRANKDKIPRLLENYQFKYYSIITCKDKEEQENLFVSMLCTYQIKHAIYQQHNTIWRTASYILSNFDITKRKILKEKENNPDCCIVYNDVEYWYVPHFFKFGVIK